MKRKLLTKSQSLLKKKTGNHNNGVNFIYLVIHQLKKPLSAMKVSLQMLLRGDYGRVSREQEDLIKKISERNESILCLIDDLIKMAELEEKGYIFRLAQVNIFDIIKSVIADEQDEIDRKKITLLLNGFKSIPLTIMVDKEKVYLALQNIVDNAVKYTPESGTIKISFKSDNNNIELQIQDSGIGIPDSEKNKLFTKFFRGNNAMKTDVVGSGLGLFIAKGIIEEHGGKISFTSKENGGSTFVVNLPIKKGRP